MTKVSVIIPIYNVEKYLRECLDSVVNQTLKDIEIILVDNGANLSEKEIIKSYQKSDIRISVIEFLNNVGYGKAVNAGIQSASGKYVSIIESDDFVDENMLEKLFNSAEHYDIDIIKSGYKEFNTDFSINQLCDLNIPSDKVFSLVEYPIFLMRHPSIWSCLYKKEFLDNHHIKFFEHKGTAWVDNPFQLESLYLAQKILYDPTPYYHYRCVRKNNASSLTEGISTPYICINDINEIVKKYNIKDIGILNCLSQRIIGYIDIIIAKLNIKNSNIAIDSINKMLDILISYNSENKKILKYVQFKNKTKLFKYIIKKKLSQISKNILFIKINKKYSIIKIFNITIYKSGEQS